jgi:hypothetical protein
MTVLMTCLTSMEGSQYLLRMSFLVDAEIVEIAEWNPLDVLELRQVC